MLVVAILYTWSNTESILALIFCLTPFFISVVSLSTSLLNSSFFIHS
nr:MAG TPA: hypothetical protein [Bacteriophage sp.]